MRHTTKKHQQADTSSRVRTLVEDDQLKELRAMADGSKPFHTIALWEKLSALEWPELKKYPPRERLALGYYAAAKRRAELFKEAA